MLIFTDLPKLEVQFLATLLISKSINKKKMLTLIKKKASDLCSKK